MDSVKTFMGFGENHVPLVKIPRKAKHVELPGIFPTRKAVGNYIRTRSKLTMDALVHADTDPDIEAISSYPIKLSYAEADRFQVLDEFEHIPQIGTWSVGGYASYFDVVPYALQQERRWIADRTAKLDEVFWSEYRATYAVLDERSLHIQPRMRNLRTMWYHSRIIDEDAAYRVLSVLSSFRVGATIDQVTEAAKLPRTEHLYLSPEGDVVQRTPLRHHNRAFSALMALATRGEITIDLRQRFSGETVVSRTLPTAGYIRRAA